MSDVVSPPTYVADVIAQLEVQKIDVTYCAQDDRFAPLAGENCVINCAERSNSGKATTKSIWVHVSEFVKIIGTWQPREYWIDSSVDIADAIVAILTGSESVADEISQDLCMRYRMHEITSVRFMIDEFIDDRKSKESWVLSGDSREITQAAFLNNVPEAIEKTQISQGRLITVSVGNAVATTRFGYGKDTPHGCLVFLFDGRLKRTPDRIKLVRALMEFLSEECYSLRGLLSLVEWREELTAEGYDEM